MKSISLDKQGIYSYQQNREPYLMIDYATEIIPGKSSAGYKDFKSDEWFFKVHWPSDPNMPGMLQIESLVQMGSLSILTLPGLKGKILYLASANKLKFFKKIVPEDTFYLKTKILSWKRGIANFSGNGYVKNTLVCKADFTLILPEIIASYKKK